MRAWAGALPSLLLRLLLTPTHGALGANPGLVARITDKGLEYGKKLRPLAALGGSAGHQTALGAAGDTDGALSVGVVSQGLAALAPSLALSPTHGAAWAHYLSEWGSPTSCQGEGFGASIDLGENFQHAAQESGK